MNGVKQCYTAAVTGNVSFCHLISYLLQMAALSGALLCQICAQMPNANRPVCLPYCQEVRGLTVKCQTSRSLPHTSLTDGGNWPQGPAAQVKYLHLTCERNETCLRGCVSYTYKYC